jgi:5-methylthioribose kinase
VPIDILLPAAIAAALSLAVDLVNNGGGAQFDSPAAAAAHVIEQMDFLVTRWVVAAAE